MAHLIAAAKEEMRERHAAQTQQIMRSLKTLERQNWSQNTKKRLSAIRKQISKKKKRSKIPVHKSRSRKK